MINLKETSIKTGLLLLGSVAAGLIVVQVTIGENGAQIGGLIPTIAAALIGLFDTVRKEQG